jgi:hypothetical protein
VLLQRDNLADCAMVSGFTGTQFLLTQTKCIEVRNRNGRLPLVFCLAEEIVIRGHTTAELAGIFNVPEEAFLEIRKMQYLKK